MDKFNDVLTKYGIRMHRKQKSAFRDYIKTKAEEMSFKSKIDKSIMAKNVVVGDIEKADIIFTAHYDTPPRLPAFFVKHMFSYCILLCGIMFLTNNLFPQMLFYLTHSIDLFNTVCNVLMAVTYSSMGYLLLHTMGMLGNANKTNYNDNSSGCIALLKLMDKYKDLFMQEKQKVAFVFFDNEEKGLFGSFAFRHKYRKIYKNKTFVNLDCVGLGKQMNLYHFGKTREICNQLKGIMNEQGTFKPQIIKSSINSLSDHYPLRKANHVCLLSVDVNDTNSIYSQIHSKNDSKIDMTNVEGIVDVISKLPQMPKIEKACERENIKQQTNCKVHHKYATKQSLKENKSQKSNFNTLQKIEKTQEDSENQL